MTLAAYITGMELADGEGVKASIQAEDVCWSIDIKDKIHTPESWAELAAEIGQALSFAHDHNEAQDRAASNT